MYRYRRINAADEVEDTRFKDGMSNLKDDFDYLLSTLDKLDRDGKTDEAIAIIVSVSSAIDSTINQGASEVQSEAN